VTILAKIGFCRQKPIFAGKNYFCQSGFYRGKKRFFPPSGKNLPTLTVTICFITPASFESL